MPKVTIPSDSYKKFQGDFRLVKSLNLTGFLKWVQSVHGSGYYDGWCACVDKFKDARGKVDIEGMDVMILDAEDLRAVLLSVRGIGGRRADEVIARITGGRDEETE